MNSLQTLRNCKTLLLQQTSLTPTDLNSFELALGNKHHYIIEAYMILIEQSQETDVDKDFLDQALAIYVEQIEAESGEKLKQRENERELERRTDSIVHHEFKEQAAEEGRSMLNGLLNAGLVGVGLMVFWVLSIVLIPSTYLPITFGALLVVAATIILVVLLRIRAKAGNANKK